jgi:hypothetical protein
VHDVQVEVVNTPVGELLAADRSHTIAVVEAVPQLGDDEELLALDNSLLDSAGNTLASFDLVTVVCGFKLLASKKCAGGKCEK